MCRKSNSSNNNNNNNNNNSKGSSSSSSISGTTDCVRSVESTAELEDTSPLLPHAPIPVTPRTPAVQVKGDGALQVSPVNGGDIILPTQTPTHRLAPPPRAPLLAHTMPAGTGVTEGSTAQQALWLSKFIHLTVFTGLWVV